ncbi:MAG: hypothetical protein ACJ797_21970 [Ktedonobacteraceae bacterium]
MPAHQFDENQGSDHLLLREYEHFLSGKAEGTIEAYLRTVRQLMDWIAARCLVSAGLPDSATQAIKGLWEAL